MTDQSDIYMHFSGLIPTKLPIGHDSCKLRQTFGDILNIKGKHTKQIKALCDCITANFPLLVITNDPQKL
jgi:hypothetical protein